MKPTRKQLERALELACSNPYQTFCSKSHDYCAKFITYGEKECGACVKAHFLKVALKSIDKGDKEKG